MNFQDKVALITGAGRGSADLLPKALSLWEPRLSSMDDVKIF
jgi:hypothetical protein